MGTYDTRMHMLTQAQRAAVISVLNFYKENKTSIDPSGNIDRAVDYISKIDQK